MRARNARESASAGRVSPARLFRRRSRGRPRGGWGGSTTSPASSGTGADLARVGACVVIVAETQHQALAAAFLPPGHAVATGADRCYFLYRIAEAVENVTLTDLDGQPLVEMYSFPTVADAKAWVEAHNRQRRTLRAAEGRAQ